MHHWDERKDKSRSFDFGNFIEARNIEDNLGIDVGIVPNLWCDIRIRDHIDNNGIWAKTVKIMRAKDFDRDFQFPNPALRHINAPRNLSQFLQKT